MNHFFSKRLFTTIGLILSLIFCCSIPGLSQDDEEVPELVTIWEDAPLYVSLGPSFSRFKDAQAAYPVKLLGEGGFLFQYSLFQQLPFWSGMEFQMRGYRINTSKSGRTSDGRYFEQKSNGDTRINYLVFPMPFSIPSSEPEKKFHVLAGPSMGLRVYFRQNYTYSYAIPSDTILITGKENITGNDALDFLDFNANLGVTYRIKPRLELWAMATYKVFGFSIGQENFFSRNEHNTQFSIKLLYRIGHMEDMPFF